MLPHLEVLCPISIEEFTFRRDCQRANYGRSSLFLDVVDRESGTFVAAAGFRDVSFQNDGQGTTCEWRIAVMENWLRRGVADEVFRSNAIYVANEPGIKATRILATTMKDHTVMRCILVRRGMECLDTDEVADSRGGWVRFSGSVNDIAKACGF